VVGLVQIIINYLEHFSHFHLLLLGRVMGGITTSLLFSAFESWMVSEHRKHGESDCNPFNDVMTGLLRVYMYVSLVHDMNRLP